MRAAPYFVAVLSLVPAAARAQTTDSAAEARTAITLDSPRTLRSGIVVGGSFGAGLSGASGYPNNSTEIGDPAFYSESGWMTGTSWTLFFMGALTDYVSVGLWGGSGVFQNGDWRSVGGGGGLRLEAFPLAVLCPRLSGLGLLAQFGIGSGNLGAKAPGYPDSDGTQSFAATGVFYEWSLAKLLGGHASAGPSLDYEAIWSRPFERHALVAGLRVAFYGGP